MGSLREIVMTEHIVRFAALSLLSYASLAKRTWTSQVHKSSEKAL